MSAGKRPPYAEDSTAKLMSRGRESESFGSPGGEQDWPACDPESSWSEPVLFIEQPSQYLVHCGGNGDAQLD